MKAPKVSLADTGLLHTLLGIERAVELDAHPKMGASFEGFCLFEVVSRLGAEPEHCFFWRTHQGAELDLLIARGRARRGFEFKHTDAPRVIASMRIAMQDLRLDSLDVIHAGRHSFPMAPRIRAVAFERLSRDL